MMLRVAKQLASNERAFSRLRCAILNDYSYRDLQSVDWKQRFTAFQSRLCSARTARHFAREAVALLRVAKDVHLRLWVGGDIVATHKRHFVSNVALARLPALVPGWRQHSKIVFSGVYPDGIRYLCLRAWPARSSGQIEPAFEVLQEARAMRNSLIIDVRANCGGSEPAAARFAGCFIQRPACYAKHLKRRGGRFIGPVERWLRPNKSRPLYSIRVAVLIGPGTVSSCESFALMMKQAPRCTLIGQRTAGTSGNPKPFDLGNGVVVYVPSWKGRDLGGTWLEGRGVNPDIEVKHNLAQLHGEDPVLATALRFLRVGTDRSKGLDPRSGMRLVWSQPSHARGI